MNSAISISTYMRTENFETRFSIFRECIKSFCDSNFEGTLHLVDDGSPTKLHLHWVGELKDKRIIVHFKNENGGIARTKNTGIRLCLEDPEVKYFFLSDDDVIFKDKNWQNEYVNVMEKTNIHHFSYALPTDARKTATIHKVNGLEIFKTSYINGCFLTGSRALVEKIGYFKVFPYKYGHEHSNFSVRCSKVYGGFFDLKNSDTLIDLNEKSHDNKSIVVDSRQLRENEKIMWDCKNCDLVE